MPPIVIIVFVLVVATTVPAALLLSKGMHKRDVDQIKDRLAGNQKTVKALKQTQLIKAEDTQKRKLAELLLGGELKERLREYIEQGGLNWEPAQLVHASLFLALVFFNLFWYVVPKGQPISAV